MEKEAAKEDIIKVTITNLGYHKFVGPVASLVTSPMNVQEKGSLRRPVDQKSPIGHQRLHHLAPYLLLAAVLAPLSNRYVN